MGWCGLNWKAFFEGLGAAAIGGAVTGGVTALQDGPISAKQVGAAALAGALVMMAGYFKENALRKPKPTTASDEPPPDPGPQG